MAKQFVGSRFRRLRLELGLSQVEMARRLDLSTSYVNQLENDQRPLTVQVLLKVTGTFGVDAGYFSTDSDARLVAELRAALSGSGMGVDTPGDADRLGDLVARYPELARHLVDLTRRLDEQHALTARLTSVTGPGPARADQFSYERVRDYFYARRNHVEELDVAAEELAGGLGAAGSELAEGLRGHLLARHGVRVVPLTVVDPPGRGGEGDPVDPPRRRFDAVSRTLSLPAGMTPGQQTFQMAVQLAFLEHSELLDRLVAESAELDRAARPLARVGLAQYFAGAVLLPYGVFLDAAIRRAYDIDLLAEHFGVGFETVCHRLSTLQRPGRSGIPFILVRTDRAGNISKRQSATAFHFSQTGGSCPLWVVHRAFETPHHVVRQLAVMPDGRRYLWIARTVAGATRGYGRAVPEFSVGLGCAVEHASATVYASGLDLTDDHAGTPIGAGCRSCPRPACVQRAFPYAGVEHVVDERVQSGSPYSPVPGPGVA